ncbi:CPBP family intramembrane glutamic endopeptidase [Methanosarcina barkeri]|uniref:CAAX amino terminal protease family protein n=1 Tax=Methanosarcina barkeri 227 TaxID=1434106 RepID=A0A0E3LQE0_METBA|nr:CPBP family intramembrane glutamic endopeptidase [Methanosarcina barkeri]AKB58106.1 CAAX amino terminal protease family protein [Methanosarcina barkeri 227]
MKLVPSSNAEPGFSKFVLSNENSGYFHQIEKYVDIMSTFGGIGAALLIFLIYRRMASKEQELIEHPPEELYPHKIWKKLGLEDLNLQELEAKRIRLFIVIPVVFIGLAELLIFAGRMKLAIWIHIGVLIALSLSDIVVKNLKIYRIYQALMLLPILRLVNLSMPVFFNTTLYTFVLVYAPLLVPLGIIVIDQRSSFEHIGITAKNLPVYIILSIPLSFLYGLGEYFTIHPGYLIPDLSIRNLFILTFIMVFFVGLVEEIIFRSILQVRIEDVLGVKEAVLIAGLLFGLMHSGYGTFHEVLYTVVGGLFMGFAFYKTRNLPFIVLLHGFVNVFLFGIFPHYISGWTIF